MDNRLGKMIDVVLDGDPFGTYVSSDRVQLIAGERDDKNPLINKSNRTRRPQRTSQGREARKETEAVPTATKPNIRDLRKQARTAGIDGWEDMSLRQLQAAIESAEDEKPARRTSTRKAAGRSSSKSTGKTPASSKSPREKATKPEREVAENGNPYKEGTNLWYITEEILRGGKRAAMVKRLKKKIELKPRNAGDDYDEDYELDRRILVTGQNLRKDYGWSIERGGRGQEDGTIVGTPA